MREQPGWLGGNGAEQGGRLRKGRVLLNLSFPPSRFVDQCNAPAEPLPAAMQPEHFHLPGKGKGYARRPGVGVSSAGDVSGGHCTLPLPHCSWWKGRWLGGKVRDGEGSQHGGPRITCVCFMVYRSVNVEWSVSDVL